MEGFAGAPAVDANFFQEDCFLRFILFSDNVGTIRLWSIFKIGLQMHIISVFLHYKQETRRAGFFTRERNYPEKKTSLSVSLWQPLFLHLKREKGKTEMRNTDSNRTLFLKTRQQPRGSKGPRHPHSPRSPPGWNPAGSIHPSLRAGARAAGPGQRGPGSAASPALLCTHGTLGTTAPLCLFELSLPISGNK